MRPMVGVIRGCLLVCCGCTHMQLERSTLKQEMTLTDLQYKQVLDNLAAMSLNPGALPYFALAGTGTAQVADQAQSMLGLSWTEGAGNGQSFAIQANRQLTESWGLTTVLDPDKLYRMRCAYQLVLQAPQTNCDQCLDRLYEVLGPDIKQPDKFECLFPHDWFCTGLKRDVPKNASYVGHYCNTYTWVMPDGVDGLTRFTLTILNLATADPPTRAVVTTYDAAGNMTKKEVTSKAEVYSPEVVPAVNKSFKELRLAPSEEKVAPAREIPRMFPYIQLAPR